MEIDQQPQSPEDAGDSGERTESVDLKSRRHGEGEVLNHIDQNGQSEMNGYLEDGVNSDAEKQETTKHKDKHHSSSKHSSSSDKDKHHSSSDKDKHRDKHSSSKHSSSSSKHHSSSSSHSHKHKSSSKDKDREGHSSSSKDKHRDGHSSSSSKHKDGSSSSSKDKHSSSEKHRSSSDKHHSSSSSDKHKSSSSKHSSSEHRDKDKHSDKDRHRDKDKERHHDKHSSSSSSKHRDGHSSSSSKHKESSSSKDHHSSKKENVEVDKDQERQKEKERQREKERQKEKERKERKERERAERERAEREEATRVKEEPESPERMDVKEEPDSDDDDVPLSVRLAQEKEEKPVKRELEESEDDEEDEPLSARMAKAKKIKRESPEKSESAKKRKAVSEDEESEDEKPLKKKKKAKPSKVKEEPKSETPSPRKKVKKGEAEQEVWKWWEEEKKDDGVKWTFLEHKGPVFAPPYEPLPKDVKFYYDGKPMHLTSETEEVATFYGKMLEHDYVTKDIFNKNFFKDWRKVMSAEEKEKITDLKKCNFREICEYFKQESEKRKNRTKEEKKALKDENAALLEEYGFCLMDGHKEKIGNFKIEPPGLFRGRGDHPKQGMLKRRTQPEDVIINCSKDSKIPQAPEGHKWKRVQHDNQVTWLASWNENIQGSTKYVMLNASSRLKGEKDWNKYETARKLHKCVDKIRANYVEDWKSKEMRIRQRAVALYFIDKLALRAGNEKDGDETADTVGCCSLRVEHLTLHKELDGKECVVEFDFLGKDSIRYQNSVPVEKRVFKNLQMFMDNKQPEDDLFDRLNTVILNKHLHDLMDGLTAKVFRTYNASRTLQEQLDLMTNAEDPVAAKMLSYNRANRAVAILCNHQRAAPKNFSKQMENLMGKIKDKRGQVKEAKKQLKEAKANFKAAKNQKNKMVYEKKKKAVERLEEQLTKLEVQATDKDENKEIALGTSKLNYLDPRISVAWCKKWNVPIEKVYNKTQRDKFRWAIDMAGPEFHF